MNNWLEQFFGGGFMPHGHCYLWTPSMVWAQVGSNALIGMAYVSIASTLGVLVRRIKDMPFALVYVAFGVFILSCGMTHWLDVVTVWRPIYWVDAAVRILTAVASVATALLILPMIPRAVSLAATARLSEERRERLEVTLSQLEEAHRQLAERAEEHRQRADLSEEQFQSLVESMPQLAWISAPDGRAIFRNARWAEYSGLDLQTLDERGWESLHDPMLVTHTIQRWSASLSSGTAFDAECRLRRFDGEYRWFIARAVPLRDNTGCVTRWVGTCTDIHEQHTLRDEALRTARMKDEFLATVSHELRTPLTAILGWARVLLRRDENAAPQRKGIETIERNAVMQAQLIEDLLDISRIVSGKMRLNMELVDPSGAVEAAIESTRLAASAKGVNLISSIERNGARVLADASRIQQIVWNLLLNSIKFTPPGGQVGVMLAVVSDHMEIAVTDTGVGIGTDFLPYVFDRFSQEDGSIRRRRGGLGIGLAIVKHLAELHGGTVSAESAGEGKGSTFTLKLPIGASTALQSADALAQTSARVNVYTRLPQLAGVRVLLVEDEPDARELVVTILAECGVVATVVEDASQALRVLEHTAFDLLLFDIGLPGQDGYELIRAIRANAELRQIPAAALTAYARVEDRRKALDAGFQEHITKPVDPGELVAILANLVQLER
ncbi:MAG: domain S-box [Myxococcaceae bacterium]|nr:domain S-box [Myxococcaceae bacterium]